MDYTYKANNNKLLNEGLFGTNHPTLREFFNIENFHCSSKTQFCIFDGDKEEPDATLVVYGYDIIEGEEEVQPYLDKRIEYINFDTLDKRVDICLITQMKESTIKETKIKTPYGKMQVVDEFVIQDDDKLAFVQKAEAKYKELDKDGWFSLENTEPYWYAFPYNRAKFTLCVSKSLGKVCFIDYRKEGYDNLFNESNVVIAPWRRERAERLIEEANKIDPSYSFVEYDIGPKKEIKYKIFKNDNEYVGTFDVFTDDPYNSPYRYFFHHVNVGGLEFQGMTIDEFNKDFNEFIELDERVGHKALNEARVFSHSSGFGLSGHYDYVVPKKEPLYIATETNEDDGELYFDKRGCTTEFKTDAKRFKSEEDALEFAKKNAIFGEPGTRLIEKRKENTMKKLNEEASERNIRYVIRGIFECNGKEKIFYYNKSLDNWSEYLVNPDPTQLANATLFKNVPKDETLEAASDAANNRKRCAVRFEDPEYELVEIIILELLKGRYGFSRVSQRTWPDGKRESLSDSVIQKEENTMKKLFENGGLFDYVLNESSSLKENVSSLEWLLDKAYVSEYRMVGKNSAEVRVRHTPELLTSDSMAARFEEDIPDGYKLEVDYLGEDPILGRNFDIYEVQLIKD